MIDIVNRFSRLIIDILLRVPELGKNDGTRNFYKCWIPIKGRGRVYKFGEGNALSAMIK